MCLLIWLNVFQGKIKSHHSQNNHSNTHKQSEHVLMVLLCDFTNNICYGKAEHNEDVLQKMCYSQLNITSLISAPPVV